MLGGVAFAVAASISCSTIVLAATIDGESQAAATISAKQLVLDMLWASN